MARYSLTSTLSDILVKATSVGTTLSSDEQSTLRQAFENDGLSSDHIRILHRYLSGSASVSSSKHLALLLRGSSVSFPSLKTSDTETSSSHDKEELERRRQYLRLRQEDREYNQLVYGSERNPHVDSTLSRGNQLSSMKYQASIGLNMLASVFVVFGMGWYIAKTMKFNDSTSLVLGLASSILMMIIEMVLFIVRAVRVESEVEHAPSLNEMALAQLNSGALRTVIDPSNTPLPSSSDIIPTMPFNETDFPPDDSDDDVDRIKQSRSANNGNVRSDAAAVEDDSHDKKNK